MGHLCILPPNTLFLVLSLEIRLVLRVWLRREPGQPVAVDVQPQRIHARCHDVDTHVELEVVDRVRPVNVVLQDRTGVPGPGREGDAL